MLATSKKILVGPNSQKKIKLNIKEVYTEKEGYDNYMINIHQRSNDSKITWK